MIVELQNTLLSNLFPNKVPRRKPLDPKHLIISTEPSEIERLQRHSKEDTDWGKKKKQTEQDFLARLGFSNLAFNQGGFSRYVQSQGFKTSS